MTLFRPYITFGFIIEWYWWSSLGIGFTFEKLPMVVQFSGRWLLWVILRLSILPKEYKDDFEDQKQSAEIACFILSFVFVKQGIVL